MVLLKCLVTTRYISSGHQTWLAGKSHIRMIKRDLKYLFLANCLTNKIYGLAPCLMFGGYPSSSSSLGSSRLCSCVQLSVSTKLSCMWQTPYYQISEVLVWWFNLHRSIRNWGAHIPGFLEPPCPLAQKICTLLSAFQNLSLSSLSPGGVFEWPVLHSNPIYIFVG